MIEAFGRTDVGRRRKINEDSFLVSPETSLCAVCDGMGGHNAGEVASGVAIETLADFVAVVASIVTGDLLTIGSAGDSRCYLVRGGELTQLTRDDSWVSAALGEGILNSDDVEHHPLRNVITKAVGARESIDLDLIEHRLVPGDVAMLCSDGLHGMLNDHELARLLLPAPGPLEETVDRLIDAANEAGGRDNVTVVLLRYEA
jgi:serine/threonine protein phosphatase PrpC